MANFAPYYRYIIKMSNNFVAIHSAVVNKIRSAILVFFQVSKNTTKTKIR